MFPCNEFSIDIKLTNIDWCEFRGIVLKFGISFQNKDLGGIWRKVSSFFQFASEFKKVNFDILLMIFYTRYRTLFNMNNILFLKQFIQFEEINGTKIDFVDLIEETIKVKSFHS
jgi:hypothetical protein